MKVSATSFPPTRALRYGDGSLAVALIDKLSLGWVRGPIWPALVETLDASTHCSRWAPRPPLERVSKCAGRPDNLVTTITSEMVKLCLTMTFSKVGLEALQHPGVRKPLDEDVLQGIAYLRQVYERLRRS